MRLLSLSLFLVLTGSASAVVNGQVDDFEDGTTQNWVVGLLGSSHPAPPANVPDGGPLGVGDNFMRLTSVGGGGSGSRMVVINPAQWSGDYLAAGISSLRMDLQNQGNTALDIRILFEKVGAFGPTDVATTNAFHLEPGGAWTSASFSLALADMTAIEGDISAALSDATVIRIFHSPTPTFPGETSAALMGVDNIQAVPEPATMIALGMGALAFLKRQKA